MKSMNSPIQWYRASRCNYIYLCVIEADGTFDLGPEGWTVEKTGTGLYKVNHDIGHTRYFTITRAGVGGDYKITGDIQEQFDTSFVISTYSSTQLSDTSFDVIVLTPQ